jgi:hypothetical protein
MSVTISANLQISNCAIDRKLGRRLHLVCAHHRRRGLRSGAGLCCGCSDDIEFLPQQSLHLSGPPPARSGVAAGPVHLLCDLRPRHGRECRHRRLNVFQERGLLARRPCRRRRRISLELRRLLGFHVETKIRIASEGSLIPRISVGNRYLLDQRRQFNCRLEWSRRWKRGRLC